MNALYAGALLVLVSSAAFVEGGLFRLKRSSSQCEDAYNRARTACQPNNYPKLMALSVAREDNVLDIIRGNSISDYCSEATSMISCNLNTVKSLQKACLSLQETVMFDAMVLMHEKVQDLVVDICTNDAQVIQDNIACLTAPQRLDDAKTCVRDAYQLQTSNECQLGLAAAYCFVTKVEEDSACQDKMAEVLFKIASQVFNIAEPMCQERPGHFMEKAQQVLKFF